MTYNVVTERIRSSDGVNTLVGKIFIPHGEIKGIFHLVHGMTEYIDRYDGIFTYLAERGYVCGGFDNLGHGKTAKNEGELGFIASKDGYKFLIDDVHLFGDMLRSRFADKDYFLMGHSMGSFIVRLAAYKDPSKIKKLIICGTGGPMAVSYPGLWLIKLIKAFKGERYVSDLVENIAFGTYNKRFKGPTKYEWLTNDRAIIDKYIKDKYCTFRFTVSAMHDLITLCIKSNSKDWFKGLDKKLPVLLISGKNDPVGDYGKGVQKVYDRLCAAGQHEALIKLYEDCRHEILNDTCKIEVFEDIECFIGCEG